MGINGLWEVIGDSAEVIPMADYAARHFQQHKRPLRIAVDEACWRFTNLTPEQVQKIREGEPSANPVEKTILWRILRLLKFNIQLIFVKDGMRRPYKRRHGRGGSKLDSEVTKLLHQLLDHLKVPRHEAPGEAEAECAAMQRQGIVDAVWSDDGDSLMFGCTTLIKQHKIASKIENGYVEVFAADAIAEKYDFDADSFLLFCVLAGGDYNTEGLRGCGPQLARKVATRSYRIASAARHVRQEQLSQWKQALQLAMRENNRAMDLPHTFPDFKVLCNYRDPNVSTPEKLADLRGLRQGWDRPMDQRKLRIILRDRFHIWTRGFLKHIAPIYLTRAMARAATSEQKAENVRFGVQLKRTRKMKSADGEEAPAKSEVKITFSPLPAVEIDLSEQPPEEDWSIWLGKDGTPYDPIQPVEGEILECFLRHGLPEGCRKPKRKRKYGDERLDSASPAKRKKKATSSQEQANEPSASAATPLAEKAKKRGRPRKEPAAAGNEVPESACPSTETPTAKMRSKLRKSTKPDDTTQRPATPPPAVFRFPRYDLPPLLALPATRTASAVVDLCDDSDDSEAERESQFEGQDDAPSASPLFVTPAKTIHLLEAAPNATETRVSNGSKHEVTVSRKTVEADSLVPGETIAPATLRELRATLLGKPKSQSDVAPFSSVVPTGIRQPSRPSCSEVIDLT